MWNKVIMFCDWIAYCSLKSQYMSQNSAMSQTMPQLGMCVSERLQNGAQIMRICRHATAVTHIRLVRHSDSPRKCYKVCVWEGGEECSKHLDKHSKKKTLSYDEYLYKKSPPRKQESCNPWPIILKFGTSFMPRLLYTPGQNPCNPLNRRLDEHQCFEEEKNLPLPQP
jgi:hypothetical protein